MKKIKKGVILPSAAFTITKKSISYYKQIDKVPEIGDVIYGEIISTNQHKLLENCEGRLHNIYNGAKSIFVFGNRYAPDYYEGFVPTEYFDVVDLLSRSGMVGKVDNKNMKISSPTRIKILGYVFNNKHEILNTKNYSLIEPKSLEKKFPRSKLIIVVGSAMNSGKSMAASAICLGLTNLGYEVRATKITGTASLKDILHMNDAGAELYADFTYHGYPSTYMLEENELLDIFNFSDLKYANNPKKYWVVELADGIMQRETNMLLKSEDVRNRIHKLIYCANDAFGIIGGLKVLNDDLKLIPDALSGVFTSAPLHIKELNKFTDIPIIKSLNPDLEVIKLLI